jgi:cytochrome P450
MTTRQPRKNRLYNPFSAEFRDNPYPAYARMREEEPVRWFSLLGTWYLTRYDDVLSMLLDHQHFSNDPSLATNSVLREQIETSSEQGILFRTATVLHADPPSHTRMRALMNKAFTTRAMEALRPRVQEIVASLLDALPDPGSMDVMSDMAHLLPAHVMAEILGVSAADRKKFNAWSTDIIWNIGRSLYNPEADATVKRASEGMEAYLVDSIEEHRREPRADFLSGLIEAEEEGDLLTREELMATVIVLLLSSNETTAGMIGNSMRALLEYPDQRRRLQDHPEMIGLAVEELLRWDSPIQGSSRVVRETFEFQGKEFKRGQAVVGLLGRKPRSSAIPRPGAAGYRPHRESPFIPGPRDPLLHRWPARQGPYPGGDHVDPRALPGARTDSQAGAPRLVHRPWSPEPAHPRGLTRTPPGPALASRTQHFFNTNAARGDKKPSYRLVRWVAIRLFTRRKARSRI